MLNATLYPNRQDKNAGSGQRLNVDNLFPLTTADQNSVFLQSLTTPSGKNKYKRYIASPLRYAGGKTLAVGLIVELIPLGIKRLISPFIGGGSVEVAVAKEFEIPVIGFDIFDILVNYWNVQLGNPEELYKRLSKFEPTREGFSEAKETLKLHWTNKNKLDKLDLAAYYFFNSNTSYGPHFLGWPSSVYLQEERYQKMVDKVRYFRAPKLKVGCSSFEEVIPKYKTTFYIAIRRTS